MVRSFLRASTVAALALSTFVALAPARAADPDADAATSSYVESIRTSLNRGKRFPTGREISIDQPSGRSEVTFSLARSGKVTAAKVTKTSNSIPLDNMARSLVRRAKYPAFPATAFAGEATHSFVVAYDFTRSPTGKVSVGEPVEVKAQ